MSRLSLLLISLTWMIVSWSTGVNAFEVTFKDVSSSQGIIYNGMSFGASWGDFNRDGHPDLYMSNHLGATAIYENSGIGFTNIINTVNVPVTGDTHGGAWGDYDNDGDQDLAITLGSVFGLESEDNLILERTGIGFIEVAATLGLQQGEARGRTPLWFDWNNDGKLDILFTNIPRNDGLAPTTLFTQATKAFENANALTGLNPPGRTSYSTLFSEGPLAPPRLLIQNIYPFPAAFYDYSSTPFVNIWDTIGPPSVAPANWDITYGDFDNDLETELYVTRITDPMTVRAITDNQTRAFLVGNATDYFGFSFSNTNQVSISVGPNFIIQPSNIKIGSFGIEPNTLAFELDASNTDNHGEFVGDLSTKGLFIHYDSIKFKWFVRLRDTKTIGVIVDSVNPIQTLQTIGIPVVPTQLQDVYLDKTGGVFVNKVTTTGLAAARNCPASASADFDNDMDLDIYLVCSDKVGNLSNQMLENDGNGFFTTVTFAAGAEGAIGGIGEAVALADFNSDGFMDILVTNGAGGSPLPDNGPTQLFQNSGNSNNWLEISLRGIVSNADGVGANVVVVAGGVTQYQLQDGGMHRNAQDHTRLHFGLSDHESVDSIEIRWPSGIVQTLIDVSANQILNIVETTVFDSDNDSIPDYLDNCIDIPNVDQNDTNADGFGNLCDPDLNNNGVVNFIDYSQLTAAFPSMPGDPNWDADADLDGNNLVNFIDIAIFPFFFLEPPGPSGIAP